MITYFVRAAKVWGKGPDLKSALQQFLKHGGKLKALEGAPKAIVRVEHHAEVTPFVDDFDGSIGVGYKGEDPSVCRSTKYTYEPLT